MSDVRLKYWLVAPAGIAKLRELEHYLNSDSGLDHGLLELVRLRASLLNGCDYCAQMHAGELKKLNQVPEKIGGIADWRSSDVYTKHERAALLWTEAVTNIQDGHAPDAVYEEVKAVFTEAETANLTLAIATINAWNRMATALGKHSSREVNG
jgi:AhpD family alkylhydroperoxidase